MVKRLYEWLFGELDDEEEFGFFEFFIVVIAIIGFALPILNVIAVLAIT